MQVLGNLAGPLEEKVAKSGKKYHVGRVAENYGKDENKTTTWYRVLVFGLSPVEADCYDKGQFVKVTGRLEVGTYEKNDGTTGISVEIIANRLEMVERKPRTPDPQDEDLGEDF